MALEKVLVVDDDPNICDVLRMYLENEGYSVILSYDGEEALVKFNALKPDIILLDEPTSNVDSINEGVILRALLKHRQGRTIILVSHRASTMAVADRVYKMENGQMEEEAI